MPSGPFLPAHTRVEGATGKVWTSAGSWLKTVARRLADASIDRRTPFGVPAAPCAVVPERPFLSRCRPTSRTRTRAAVRSECRNSARQVQVTAARPAAAPAAPAQGAPLKIRTRGTRAQLNAPQRTTSLTGSGDLSDGNGTAHSPRTGCYYNAADDHGSPRGVRTGQAGALPSAPRSGMLRGTFEAPPTSHGRCASVAGSGQRGSGAVLLGYRVGKMIPSRIVPL